MRSQHSSPSCSSSRDFSECVVPPVCEDLLLAIFEDLPSRVLVKLRSVSRQFAVLVDEILRGRFLVLTADDANELVLESCAPYETRACHRQPLAFSHFGPDAALPPQSYTGNIAHFKLASNPPVPQFLPLDEGELFAQNILSIHLRNAPKKDVPVQEDFDGDIELASPPTPPVFDRIVPQSPQFDYSLSLASSLDRLFRSYFESPSPTPSPARSRESSPLPPPPSSARETRSYRLACPYNPSSRSALFAAEIECFQVEASPSSDGTDSDGDSLISYGGSPGSSPSSFSCYSQTPGSRYASACPTPPRLFEYYFSCVEMDVGKVVVAAEEGLPYSGKRQTRGVDSGVVVRL
ncbi:hypothetical protein JCM6882_006455 [Rhodosporidiobolus microsporus]